jgi:hypothetical protein
MKSKAAAGGSAITKFGRGQLPSQKAKVSPDKAGTILKHGEVKGHALSKAQKGMFGAIRGKAK